MFGVIKNWRRPWTVVALLGIGAIGFALGTWNRHGGEVAAQPPGSPVIPASDYSQRVIAYIHGNVPITREDLGEFLIARYGQSKVELMVNRKIIDYACQQHKIAVEPAEAEAALNEDMGTLRLDRA